MYQAHIVISNATSCIRYQAHFPHVPSAAPHSPLLYYRHLPSCILLSHSPGCIPAAPLKMQPNQWQQQSQYGYGGGGPQGFQGGNPQFGQLGSQPTGFGMGAQPTGFQPSPRPPQPTGGNMGFLNAPPGGQFGGARGGMSQGFTGSGLSAQMTGFPAGGASGLLGQQTGFQGGGGLMPQATGFPGGGLVSQPTGFHDPRLQSMMQSFMPSNLSQVSSSSHSECARSGISIAM